ncbi:hypothetical protein K523DRAFT_60482 [Schizophyllum commune Tattone D]|nr:hypothetical protein K523DRAFT_60482 [Schizophyllum commune Tattone D]
MYASVQALLDTKPQLPANSAVNEVLYENAAFESEHQRKLVEGLISERETHLRGLEAEITTLVDALDGLRQQQKTVRDELDVCRSAVSSPIRALPIDLITAILESTVDRTPWDPNSERSYVSPTVVSLLRTTQVCRAWRLAMHGKPTLWSELILEWGSISSAAYTHGSKACITQWFSRAGELPLSLTIRDSTISPPDSTWYRKTHSVPSSVDSDELLEREQEEEEDYYLYNMSQLLGSSAVFPTHRLRVLRLVGYERHISPNLSDLPPDSFPLLEHLCLKYHGYSEPSGTISAFSQSARLRKVELWGWLGASVIKHVRLPWAELTDIAIWDDAPIRLQSLQDTLAMFASVVRLTMRLNLVVWEQDVPRQERIVLHQLEYLLLYATIPELDRLFIAPKLASLKMGANFSRRPITIEPFLTQTPRLTSFTIRSLSIIQGGEAEQRVKALLRLLARVENLSFADCALPLQPVFEALTVIPGADVLLPRLQVLELQGIYNWPDPSSSWNADSLVVMVRSRWTMWEASRLRRVLYSPADHEYFPGLSDDGRQSLRQMKEEGFDIEVSE